MPPARTARPVLAALLVTAAVAGLAGPAAAQRLSEEQTQGAVMDFEAYTPPSTLVVPETEVSRARFPFVDVHNHQWDMDESDLSAIVAEMDALNMAVMVNLSGRSSRDPEHFDKVMANVRENAPDRFLVFTNVDFNGVGGAGWAARAEALLRSDIAAGAAGLKIYKNLGMDVFDSKGKRVPVDDPRLDPIWSACGELGVPVLIHSGDPAPFWQPWDEQNERWLELKQRPRRKRDGETGPSWEQVMDEHWSLFARHPETTFISAHLGWLGHDLTELGRRLDAHPNVVTEIGAVIAELGRQPRAAARWFEAHQDQVLFGKDVWTPSEYHCYFRVLETDDEYFDYYRRRHAFWKMYGLDLPDAVLRKLYYGNAVRLFPQIDRSLFPTDG